VDGTGRAERFEDNLVSTLSAEQIATLREQLSGGDGRELEFASDGTRPDAHAAHSSSALAFNAFGGWLGHEQDLVADGVTGFTDQLRVEARQRIFRGGRAPNLDCVITGPEVVLGVESKLTEFLSPHSAKQWSPAYSRDSCRALFDDGWLRTLDDAIAGDYHPRFLDATQLLKHALGVSKQHPARERHLLYVFWEPCDADDHGEFALHRAEVAEFAERVGTGSPRFHALSYPELWDQWANVTTRAWLSDHIRALKDRYAISLSMPPPDDGSRPATRTCSAVADYSATLGAQHG
jgi:hypothetical protein